MKLYRYMALVGVFFVIGGGVSAVAGGLAMSRFLRAGVGVEDFTVRQLARGMILPHIFMFMGLGVAVYGVILLARGISLRRRMRLAERGS